MVDYGVAVGYTWGNIRVELERIHFNLNVAEQGYHDNKPAKYLELIRDPGDTPVVIMRDDIGECVSSGTLSSIDFNQVACRFKHDIIRWNNSLAASLRNKMQTLDPNLQNNIPVPAAFKMENKGFTTYAGMINAYYDADWSMGLYAGVGLGLAKVHFLVNKDKIPSGINSAFQVRGGGKYSFSQTTKFYFGMRALWTKCEFVDIKPSVAIKGSGGDKQSTTAYIRHDIYFVSGLECGLMYNF